RLERRNGEGLGVRAGRVAGPMGDRAGDPNPLTLRKADRASGVRRDAEAVRMQAALHLVTVRPVADRKRLAVVELDPEAPQMAIDDALAIERPRDLPDDEDAGRRQDHGERGGQSRAMNRRGSHGSTRDAGAPLARAT